MLPLLLLLLRAGLLPRVAVLLRAVLLRGVLVLQPLLLLVLRVAGLSVALAPTAGAVAALLLRLLLPVSGPRGTK